MGIDFVRHDSALMAYQTSCEVIDESFSNSMCSKDLGPKRIALAFVDVIAGYWAEVKSF